MHSNPYDEYLQASHSRISIMDRLAFITERPRMQRRWFSIVARFASRPPASNVAESIDLSEQHSAMRHRATMATRDPRLNAQIDAFLAARHSDPFALLGPHPTDGNWTVRFFLPWATEACISLKPPAVEGTTLPMTKVTDAVKLRPEGFFEASWPSNQFAPPV